MDDTFFINVIGTVVIGAVMTGKFSTNYKAIICVESGKKFRQRFL